jgi:tol-pal system protein YbgF
MRLPSVVLSLGLVLGCASAAPRVPADARAARQQAAQREALEAARVAEAERARELEGRLALVQAEARDLRYELAARAPEPLTDTVRIGARVAETDRNGANEGWQEPEGWSSTQAEPEVDEDAPEEEEDHDAGRRPVLRLYGEGSVVAPLDEAAPFVAPLPPPGVPTHLPVVPLPSAGTAPVVPAASALPARPPFIRGAGAAAPSHATARREAAPSTAPARYREALGAIRDRRFADALESLDAFLAASTDHPYAARARYWRGEVLYAQRAYRRAQADFEVVVERDPRGAKTPDALLKLAMCHRRLGDAARAQRYFERLQREFPSSVAARVASEEDPG